MMCRGATVGRAVGLTALVCSVALGQDWRRVGNAALDLSLASPATGAVERVWFSNDGARVFAQTRSGRVFSTGDFENWETSNAIAPDEPRQPVVARAPSSNARLVAAARGVYAL
ncbi:MAG: hypothetical protein ACRD96_03265, partial [Bryobacteraceae bacterium]